MSKRYEEDLVTKKALDKNVKLIGENNELIGIMPLRKAWKVARERNCDMILASSNKVEPAYRLYAEQEIPIQDERTKIYESGKFIRRWTQEEIEYVERCSEESTIDNALDKALTRLVCGGLGVGFVIVMPLLFSDFVSYYAKWWVAGTYVLTLVLACILVQVHSKGIKKLTKS